MPGLNATTLLLSQGWAGPGHPLQPPSSYRQHGNRGLAYDPKTSFKSTSSNNSSNGLVRPLLASKKSNTLGLGRRTHEPAKGNEWWLKGFEAALGSVGNSTSGASTPVNGTEGTKTKQEKEAAAEELQRSVNAQLGRFGGLYSYFLRGGVVEGTLGEEEGDSEEDWGRTEREKNKRKSDVLRDDDYDESGDERGSGAERSGKKRRRKHDTITTTKDSNTDGGSPQRNKTKSNNSNTAEQQFSQIASFLSVRDRQHDARRRQRHEEKRRAKAIRASQAFCAAGAFLGAGDNGKMMSHDEEGGNRQTAAAADCEKGRNKKKKDKRKKKAGVESTSPSPSPLVSVSVSANEESEDDKQNTKKKRRRQRLLTTDSGEERPETREERRVRRAGRRARKEAEKEEGGKGRSRRSHVK